MSENERMLIITGLIGILGTVIGTLINGLIIEPIKNRTKLLNKKKTLITQLVKLRLLRQQLFLSRFEAYINSDYHEYRFKISNNPVDFEEAKRWMIKSENQVFELQKINAEFLEILEKIIIYFELDKSKNKKILKLIKKNKHYRTPKINVRPNEKWNLEQLILWKNKAIEQISNISETEYKNNTESLVNELHKLI